MNLNKCNWEFLHIHAIKEVFQQIFFFHKCLLNSVGVGLGFIEPRAMIIAKALFHCSMHAAIQTEKCIFLSWAALLRCGPLAQPSPARPAQHGPAWPNWTQPRPTTSTNCKSKQLFFLAEQECAWWGKSKMGALNFAMAQLSAARFPHAL